MHKLRKICFSLLKSLFVLVFGCILPVCFIIGTFNNLCYKSPDICLLVKATALYSISLFVFIALFVGLPVWFILDTHLQNNIYSIKKA